MKCWKFVALALCGALLLVNACRPETPPASAPTATPADRLGLSPAPRLPPMLVTSLPSDIKADVVIDMDTVAGASPTDYGTNGWWTDEDADLWRARYALLSPTIVRLPVIHGVLEPTNDDGAPNVINWKGFRFNVPFPVPASGGRHVTYRRWFEALRDLNVTVLIYTPYLAGWLSANGDRGLYSTFPPKDVAEYGEFVRALLTYLVKEVAYPPDRIILEPVNEADLGCGSDPAVSCFWENWQIDDLVLAVRTAHDQAAAVHPAIRIAGLSTCCETDLLARFMAEYEGGQYLDVVTYHRYENKFEPEAIIVQGRKLQAYGKPVLLEEYGNKQYWSNGPEGALWHSVVLPLVWAAGITPIQFSIAEWPGMHEGYVKLGLFADWRDGWQIKPAYWVYVNYYTYLHDTEMISATAPSGTLVMARRRAATETLAVWLTNGELEKQGNVTFQINHWPADGAVVTAFDNLAGPDPVVAYRLAADGADGRLTFDYAVPSRTSFLFVVQPQSVP